MEGSEVPQMSRYAEAINFLLSDSTRPPLYLRLTRWNLYQIP
jgi:hypothetical protein